MNIVTIHPLCDGPLDIDGIRAERAKKVAAMARLLLDWNCWGDVHDCRLVLRHSGYSRFEVEALLPDARQVAVQHAVEMAMAVG